MAGTIFAVLFILLFLGVPLAFGLVIHCKTGDRQPERTRAMARRARIMVFLGAICAALDISAHGIRLVHLLLLAVLVALLFLSLRRKK